MGDKIQKELSRKEFADYLAALSEQVREGKVTSEKGVWSVPEELGAKIQLKEKKGRIELKINCRWSTLADYTAKDREKIVDWRDSMKSVKKRMGISFKEITRSASAGEFPDTKHVDDLVETSRIFSRAADSEWKDAMDEYMDHLENFVRAVEGHQFDQMLHEIRDLQYRMKSCHKEYK
jgi:XXXCH domain-containing protein